MVELLGLLKGVTGAIPHILEQRRQLQPPLITIKELTRDYSRAWQVMTPRPVGLQDGPPQLDDEDIRGWFVRNRAAVPSTDSFLLVEITGRSKAVTRITDVRADVVARNPPYTGAYILCPPAGAGDVENIYLDLDRPHRGPLLDQWPDNQPPSQPYFHRRSLSLAQQESVTLVIRAGTDLSSCEWRLQISYRIGRKHEAVYVSSEVWKTSSSIAATQRLLWRWWEEPNGLIKEEDE